MIGTRKDYYYAFYIFLKFTRNKYSNITQKINLMHRKSLKLINANLENITI